MCHVNSMQIIKKNNQWHQQSLRGFPQFVDSGLTLYVSKSMTFPPPHIGHSRHGLFFTRWIVNPILNLLKRTMTYPGFEPGTSGLAVGMPNHYTIYSMQIAQDNPETTICSSNNFSAILTK
jgi:hypothetical protein